MTRRKRLICFQKDWIKENLTEGLIFTLIGVMGVVVNLALLYLLVDLFGFHYLLSATVLYLVLTLFTFSLDKVWAFHEKLRRHFVLEYFKYLTIIPIALVVNLFFLNLLTEYFGMHYLYSQTIAIFAAGIVKFFLNKKLTFLCPSRKK